MRTIAILSGKGGVGKTTTAVNLGAALAKFADVIVVDANVSMPSLMVHLGNPALPRTLHDALVGRIHPTRALYRHASGMKVMPASVSLQDFEALDAFRLADVLRQLEGHGDIIIVDSAPGLGGEAATSLEACSEVLIVTNPELAALTGALKTIKAAQRLKKQILGVVLTRVGVSRHEMREKDVALMLGVPIIAVIRHDTKVLESLGKSHPVVHVFPRSKVALDYVRLAKTLMGAEEKPKKKLLTLSLKAAKRK